MDVQTFFPQHTAPTILCCMCGTAIQSNPANMCVNCVRSQVDITEGIPKQIHIFFCRRCGRWMQPPNTWIVADLESRELLTFCIKRTRGLTKVKVVGANFVWTEPHSRRIKVKYTVQKEVFAGAILEQVFVVEYFVNNQQCIECQRIMADNTWVAVAQVRQRVDHKKTFFFLEQVILKHGAHAQTTNIKERPDGLDFYFQNRSHAVKFIEFISAVVPARHQVSKRLISYDEKSNISNSKFTFSVELAPVCREDLVCLPKKVAHALGNINQLVLCAKVASSLHFIDPNTLQTAEIQGSMFWRCPFGGVCHRKQLVEYIVIDCVPLGPTVGKYALADITVARACDFGVNDRLLVGRTHLGRILQAGDSALGYDIPNTNFNDVNMDSVSSQLPDFVLVKKHFPNRKRFNKRFWQLQNMNKEIVEMRKVDAERREADMEEFMTELEEDPEMRSQVNLYKAPRAEEIFLEQQQTNEEMMLDQDESAEFPEVRLEELLEGLTIDDDLN